MKRILVPLLVTLIGIFFSYLIMAPGMMSNDSINQYEQAVSGSYLDLHPPILSFIWRHLLFIQNNQMPILLLHCGLFWTGLFLLSCSFPRHFLPVFIVLVGFFPPIFVQLGMIWKDVSVVSFFLFSIGLSLFLKKQHNHLRFSLCSIVLIALWIGMAARHNALFAVVPILFFLFDTNQSFIKRMVKTAVILFTFVILQVVLNQYILKVEAAYPAGQIYLFDTVAIAARVNDLSVIPEYVSNSLHVPKHEIVKPYTPTSGAGILFYGGKSMLPLKDSWYYEAKSYWIKAVSQYPLIYLQHRYEVFLSVIGWNSSAVYYPWHNVVDPNPYGLVASDRDITKSFFFFMETLRNGYLLRVWVYLTIACGILFFLLFRKDDVNQPDKADRLRLAIALCISALCYSSAYFFIAPVSDLRFNYWTIDAISIALLLFLSVYIPPFISRAQKLLPEIFNKR